MIIDGREIGPGHPPYIIAEISCNHSGILERALQMMWWAKWCGADAVKFQCYTAAGMTIDCDKPDFILKEGPWKGRKLWDLYNEAHTPPHWFPIIAAKAEELGITWFASVFDRSGVDILENLECPAYKIASFEITDLPLIRYAASKGKPVVLSTGMASREEVEEAAACLEPGDRAILRCVSSYPAKPEDYDLRGLGLYADGISDHTLGHDLAVAATACGARIIEKHFCLARELGGPDAAFSMEPQEFKRMVKTVRGVWAAMQEKKRPESERPQLQARRSLYCVRDIAKGEIVRAEHVRSIRPGYGLPPGEIDNVLGLVARRKIERGEALNWGMFKEEGE